MAQQVEGCLVAPQDIELLCGTKSGNEFLDALPAQCLTDEVPDGMTSLGCLASLQFNEAQEESEEFCLGDCEPMEIILGRITSGLDLAMRCWNETTLALALGGGEWVAQHPTEATLIKPAVSKVQSKGVLLRFKGGTVVDSDTGECTAIRFGLAFPCATFSRNLALNFGSNDGNKTPMDLGASIRVLSAPKGARNPNGQSSLFKTTHPDILAVAA